MQAALITGVAGYELTEGERAFLSQSRPAGVILFTRNCRDHEQIRKLVGDIRHCVGSDEFLVLIDQEGGRVQRLRGALGRALPPGRRYGRLYAQNPERGLEAAYSIARLTAEDLRALDIDTNCAPVLDVPAPGAHEIIGDRAYGDKAPDIIAIAREVIAGYSDGGVVPVIKHIPGHGRAGADSHLALPIVRTSREELSKSDFMTFRALSAAPAAMTAHVVFSDIDAGAPASTSARVTASIIRGEIGFEGLLMSDDLSMQALQGPIRARAEAVIAAGSDVALHCNGDMAEMQAAAAGVPRLEGPALARFQRACRVRQNPKPYDREQALWLLGELMEPHSHTVESV